MKCRGACFRLSREAGGEWHAEVYTASKHGREDILWNKPFQTSGKKSAGELKSAVIKELTQYCGGINPSAEEVECWPGSVAKRWENLNSRKSSNELGILSWNTNGRLDFRGCREGLIRRWAKRGFVDVGLIQEHFKNNSTPLFDMFGQSWWNITSGAVGASKGRKSGDVQFLVSQDFLQVKVLSIILVEYVGYLLREASFLVYTFLLNVQSR